jgi:hypothetical protein
MKTFARSPWTVVTGVMLALAGSATGLPAWADEVHLQSGQVVEGTVRQEPGRTIVETGLGTLTFPADQVKEILPRRSAMDEYSERFAALGPKPKAADVYALAVWARDHNLIRYVNPLLVQTIRIDPQFAPAHRDLDQVQSGGQWIPRQERDTREAAVSRAMTNREGSQRPKTRAHPRPEMDPGYVYFGIPPMAPPRGSQVHAGYGYVFPIFHGVAVVP